MELTKRITALIAVEIFIVFSIWLTQFISLSIVRHYQHDEIQQNSYFKYALLYVIIMITSFVISSILLLSLVSAFLINFFMTDKTFVQCCITIFKFTIQNYSKMKNGLWIGLTIMFIVITLLLLFHIDIGYSQVVNFFQQYKDDKEYNLGIEDNDLLTQENIGMGYIYKLYVYISSLSFVLIPASIFIIAIIE